MLLLVNKSFLLIFMLVLKRYMCEFPEGCGWDYVVKKAKCKKEATKLEVNEELGLCIPPVEKSLEIVEETITDLTPVNSVPDVARKINNVMIHKRTKSAMQSGTANTNVYMLTFMGGPQWENPLMGWTSASNPLRGVELFFPDIESATFYARSNGWNYFVPQEEKKKKMPKKDYGLNFSWIKRTRVSTK